MTVSHVADCPDLGPQCFNGASAPAPYNHHIDQLMAESVFDASLGITPWLAIDTRWSLRVADVNPTYSELDGTPKEVPDDIHHQDETLVDVTDPWLLGRLASVQGNLVGVLRMGASFPVGRREPDPYALGREGKSHEHLQAGTGTVVPIVGFGVAYTVGRGTNVPVTLGLGGIGFFSAYENDEGFQAPVRLYASHRVAVSFLDGRLSPFAEGTLAHEGEEFWNGEVGLEGSNVRTEVYVGGGLEYRFYDAWAVEPTTRARVATLTDAPSFKSFGIFSLSVSTGFDLWDTKAERSEEPAAPQDEPGPKIHERNKGGVIEFEKD
jgi:hypothetical protein